MALSTAGGCASWGCPGSLRLRLCQGRPDGRATHAADAAALTTLRLRLKGNQVGCRPCPTRQGRHQHGRVTAPAAMTPRPLTPLGPSQRGLHQPRHRAIRRPRRPRHDRTGDRRTDNPRSPAPGGHARRLSTPLGALSNATRASTSSSATGCSLSCAPTNATPGATRRPPSSTDRPTTTGPRHPSSWLYPHSARPLARAAAQHTRQLAGSPRVRCDTSGAPGLAARHFISHYEQMWATHHSDAKAQRHIVASGKPRSRRCIQRRACGGSFCTHLARVTRGPLGSLSARASAPQWLSYLAHAAATLPPHCLQGRSPHSACSPSPLRSVPTRLHSR